jgi:hypothetical protein
MSAKAIRNRRVTGSCSKSNATMLPANGAVEKYAPVRAAPRYPSATMKRTRLSPYPKNPRIAVATTPGSGGTEAPRAAATATFTVPLVVLPSRFALPVKDSDAKSSLNPENTRGFPEERLEPLPACEEEDR